MIFQGKITKTRSNKGEVVIVSPPNINITDLKKGEKVIVKGLRREYNYTIEYTKYLSRQFILKLAEINSISEALKITGHSIYLITQITALPLFDSIYNYKVIDKAGKFWGTVTDIIKGNQQTLLSIKHYHKTILIPLVEEIIAQVDPDEKTIIINPPPGLMELNS